MERRILRLVWEMSGTEDHSRIAASDGPSLAGRVGSTWQTKEPHSFAGGSMAPVTSLPFAVMNASRTRLSAFEGRRRIRPRLSSLAACRLTVV